MVEYDVDGVVAEHGHNEDDVEVDNDSIHEANTDGLNDVFLILFHSYLQVIRQREQWSPIIIWWHLGHFEVPLASGSGEGSGLGLDLGLVFCGCFGLNFFLPEMISCRTYKRMPSIMIVVKSADDMKAFIDSLYCKRNERKP